METKLKELFKDYNPKEIGKHFGILMIKINGTHYEIAKFRKDIGKTIRFYRICYKSFNSNQFCVKYYN